jgi:protein TonB
VNSGGDAVTHARLGLWLAGSLLLHAYVVQFVDVDAVSARPSMGSLRVTLLDASSHDAGATSATVVSTLSSTVPTPKQREQTLKQREQTVEPAPPVIAEVQSKTVKAVVVVESVPAKSPLGGDQPMSAAPVPRAVVSPAAKQPGKVRSRNKVPQRKLATTTHAKAKPAPAVTRPLAEIKPATTRIAERPPPAPQPQPQPSKSNELAQAEKPLHTAGKATSTALASVSTASKAVHRSGAARMAERDSNNDAAADSSAETSAETSDHAAGHAVFLQLLHAAIDGHKRYPRMARRLRREGVATVLFRLHPDGDLDALALADSSGFAALDAAALRAVAAVAPFTPAAKFLTRETRFRVGVEFHLH